VGKNELVATPRAMGAKKRHRTISPDEEAQEGNRNLTPCGKKSKAGDGREVLIPPGVGVGSG